MINPPVLGKKRRKLFEQQFQNWQTKPPPISYNGVNKNHLVLEESKYQHLIKDDRRWWVKLKLRLGWEKYAQDFAQKYDPMLTRKKKDAAVRRIGSIAAAFSQIEIWNLCRKMPADDLCMIVEDDAIINPAIPFDGIGWPESADFLHLWPGGIGQYEKYSDQYVKVLQKWEPNKLNYTALGYVITPACARRFCSELVPYDVQRTIDTEILYSSTPNLFAVRTPWVRPVYTTSFARQPSLLHVLARPVAYAIRAFLPSSLRSAHPYLLDKKTHTQFDQPRLD